MAFETAEGLKVKNLITIYVYRYINYYNVCINVM